MKREILFRGQRKSDGQWVEGNYFHNIRKGEGHNIITKHDNEWHEVDPETIGQFTDKYGIDNVRIWEGDVDKDGGVVEWWEDSAQFLVIYDCGAEELVNTDDWWITSKTIHDGR